MFPAISLNWQHLLGYIFRSPSFTGNKIGVDITQNFLMEKDDNPESLFGLSSQKLSNLK